MARNDVINSDGSINYNTIGGFKDRLDGHDTSLAQIAYYPESYKSVSDPDYTNAFATIMSKIASNGGGSILLGQGKTYTGNLVINTSNVHVHGKGTLQGIIQIQGVVESPDTARYSGTRNITIHDITINGQGTRDGIQMQYAYGISIDGVRFQNCIKSVVVNTIDYTQHVSRVKIINNHFKDCSYAYYVDRGASTKYICGDVTFNNNVDESTPEGIVNRISTVYANGQDGIVCSGNTMFGGGGQSTSGTVINIQINNSNFIDIAGNHLFSPTQNCIKVTNTYHVTITGNNVVWAQQDGIFLDTVNNVTIVGNTITWYQVNGQPATYTGNGILMQNNNTTYFNISGNTIIFPYKNGIRVVTAGQGIISNNMIRNIDSTVEAIYSNGDYTLVANNNCMQFTVVNTVIGYNGIENGTYSGGTAVLLQTPIQPFLLNGFTNYGSGFSTIQYYKEPTGIVHLEGTVKAGATVTSATAIFQLPTGYRPLTNRVYAVTGDQGYAKIEVDTTGNVTISNSTITANTGNITLDGIHFRTT